MKKINLKILIESSILISLGLILNCFSFFKMTYGGNISLAIVPLLVFSLRNGFKKGTIAGIIFSLLSFFLDFKYTFHFLSIFFDYLLPGFFLGFIVLYNKLYKKFLLIFSLRFLSFFLSGILVWFNYSKGMNILLYSFLYNFSYVFPETLISFIILYFLKKNTRIFNEHSFCGIIKIKNRK